MSSGVRRIRAAVLLCASAVGVVGGHQLGYLAAFPDPFHRRDVLAHTGHGYLPTLSSVLATLAVACAVTALVLGYRRRRHHLEPRPRFGRTFLTLALVQSSAFVTLEVVERVVAGLGPVALLGPVLWVGLVAQLVVAVVAAGAMVVLDRLGERIASVPIMPLLGEREPIRTAGTVRRFRSRPFTAYAGRAPPAVLLH